MARDRSRSPRKDAKRRHRTRSRSRSRGRDHEQERKRRRHDRTSRSRSKSRSPKQRRRSPRSDDASRGHRSQRSRRRSRSRSRDDDVVFVCEQRPGDAAPPVTTASNPVDLTGRVVETSEDDSAMMKLMGFSTFDSTKGKKVEGNDDGTSRINVKRKYRQYMNRVGGFNRPLDPVH